MAKIIYTNNIVEEEEEAKDDEVRPPSALYQKNALGELLYILRNDD